ncbi:MAG: acetolactate synthase [Methanomassiliicoccales archaeon]|nr:acetolactate synthase [Methanomassiliicoccales archaeon]TFG56003.1 MAG: acetolactate synthase [Methanomassiliicoccus sp.]
MTDSDKYRIKQLSIFSENRPNRLGAVANVLKEGGINILGFSIAEGAGYGVIRVLVDRPEVARDLLTKEGFVVKFTEVLAIQMEDRPGGLFDLTDHMKEVNIEYGYGYRNPPYAVLIVRVEDIEKGIENLLKGGLRLLDNTTFH